MTRTEHLLCIVAEECNEVAQRVSKALRFGLAEVQPGQDKTNAQRMAGELLDLIATWDLLAKDQPGVIEPIEVVLRDRLAYIAKLRKVEKFLTYSAECGTLTTGAAGGGV